MFEEKLTEKQRVAMFTDLLNGASQRVTAEKYGVSVKYVHEFFNKRKEMVQKYAPYVHAWDKVNK